MSNKSRVRIKASCGCGFIIAGIAKGVIEAIKEHSNDTGHTCEIHGTVIFPKKEGNHYHRHKFTKESVL